MLKKNFADTCNFFQMYIITSTHRLPTPATFDTCQTLHTSTSSFTVCTLCTGWYVSFSPMVSLPYRLQLSTNSFWINVYGKKFPPPGKVTNEFPFPNMNMISCLQLLNFSQNSYIHANQYFASILVHLQLFEH